MSPRRARVDDLPAPEQGEVLLPAQSSHHLLNVLRLRPGASVILFDGAGTELPTTLESVIDGRALLRVQGAPSQRAPTRPAHLVLALIKPKPLDLALRMGVEIGLTHVHLYQAQRSQGRPPRPERWEKILESAATQCGRADLPNLSWSPNLAQALDDLGPDLDLYLAAPGAPQPPRPAQAAGIIVGPEGGLTPSEGGLALSLGAQPIGLSAWTLRAETAAALAAGYICPEQ